MAAPRQQKTLPSKRTKGRAFRGTTSIRRRPTHSPPRPTSGLRCNGLTRSGLLSPSHQDFFGALLGRPSAGAAVGALSRRPLLLWPAPARLLLPRETRYSIVTVIIARVARPSQSRPLGFRT